ncbi:MAG TPA: FAD:protein FMN transferase [Actinobacteria bacterium]|nr:FAD:protein FMN transferase [Actinomycetota bacterium]
MKTNRSLCKPFLLISVLSIVVLYLFLMTGCSSAPKRFEDTREKMGTFVNIIIYGDEDNYAEILESSFGKIDELNKIASNYDPESSVSVLNRDGIIKNAPEELVEILNVSKEYNKKTEGAFDITVNPILELWSEGLWQESEEIQKQKINEALKLVDSEQINIEGDTITLGIKGMSLTLGGVAKGYIVDEVIELIKSRGIESALVNAGGDIRILGAKPDGSPWKISLENPDNTSEQIIEFALADKSIATSGNYYRYFDPEKEVHHIIDPRTGFSSNKCISVTIIAENATIADILATSVFVLGPEDGIRVIEGIENVEAFIIDNERNFHKSSGIEKFIVE